MLFNVNTGHRQGFVGIVKALNTNVGKKFRRNWKILFQILQSFFGLKINLSKLFIYKDPQPLVEPYNVEDFW